MKTLMIALATLGAGLVTGRILSEPTEQSFTRTIEHSGRYLLSLPAGYDEDAERRWPLLVFLHGAGERGDDLERVATHWPPRIAGVDDFPFVVVAPQCEKGRTWSPDAVLALLDHAVERYRVDEERVYLTGLSMGGYGTWATAARAPERFAAIVPVCGGGSFIDAWQIRGKIPVWAFHGTDDRAVPASESERMVELLKKFGGEARLTTYEGVGHDAWNHAYAENELWTWLAEQRR